MELNKIQSSGSWGKAADDLNQNFSKVNNAVEQVKNATTRNKGYFSTDTALKSAFKSASLGDIAYVQNSNLLPFERWEWDGTQWIATGVAGGDQKVELGDYYTKDVTDAKLSELGSKIGGIEIVQTLTFSNAYEWVALKTPIAKGSVIEISGADVSLNFYAERFGDNTPYLITKNGVAEKDFTYVRNLAPTGEITVKSATPNRIDVLEKEVEEINSKIGGGESVQTLTYASSYEWVALETPIKKGSTIEISGADASLNFYSVQFGTPHLITGSGIAEEDYTYTRNLDPTGDITIKSVTPNNIELIKLEVDSKIGSDWEVAQSITFTGNYEWAALETPIKKGSVVKISGADTLLNFYTEKGGTAHLIAGTAIAEEDYTYVRNLEVQGNIIIELAVPNRIDVLEKEVEEINKVKIPALDDKIKNLTPTNLENIEKKLDVINSKIEDVESEQTFTFSKSYEWAKLNPIVKKGSVVEISGVDVSLNFYTEQYGTAFLITEKGIAQEDYTYVRNLAPTGEITLKSSIKSQLTKIGEKLDSVIGEDLTLIVNEPIHLSSTSEHSLYLDDMVSDASVVNKFGLTGTQLTAYGSIAYANRPNTGRMKGTFLALSNRGDIRTHVNVNVHAPSPKSINMLDIGSSYIDIGIITKTQYDNYTRDGYTVNLIGTMGNADRRHEARSGGTWDFLTKPLGRAVIVDVNGVTSLPTTGYPGTTYMDENGIKWTVRGVVISAGQGKVVLSSFSVDTNYGGDNGGSTTDYDVAALNLPSSGTLTKTTNDSTGTITNGGDDTIVYNNKELVYYNPFWNPTTNELDFQYYIGKWGFGKPDVISLTFGSNDLGNFAEATDSKVEEVVSKAVEVVDKIHTQYPSCKILITTSCYGYKGVAQDNFREEYRARNLQKYYRELIRMLGESTSYSSYVRIVPTLFSMDRINSFQETTIQLHSSYPPITIGRDIVHPNNGFDQFANAMTGCAYSLGV